MVIIGDGDIEVVMVAAVLRVAVVIRSSFSTCMFVLVFVVLLGEAVLIVVVVVILFLTNTITTTTGRDCVYRLLGESYGVKISVYNTCNCRYRVNK